MVGDVYQTISSTSLLLPHTSLTDWKTEMQDATAVFFYY